jgi:hypothetical protein
VGTEFDWSCQAKLGTFRWGVPLLSASVAKSSSRTKKNCNLTKPELIVTDPLQFSYPDPSCSLVSVVKNQDS